MQEFKAFNGSPFDNKPTLIMGKEPIASSELTFCLNPYLEDNTHYLIDTSAGYQCLVGDKLCLRAGSPHCIFKITSNLPWSFVRWVKNDLLNICN
jgi:hypothetical protein